MASSILGQAITWISADGLLIASVGKKLKWNFNKNEILFIEENVFENVCKMDFFQTPMYQVIA